MSLGLTLGRPTAAGDATPPATITRQTSITFDGVTFNFDRAVDTCVSCLGEPAVVSNQAFAITSITPASATVNSFVAHGAQVDPYDTSTSQGFDAMLADVSAAGQSASGIAYSAGLNIDPGAAGSDYEVAENDAKSIVKSVRLSTKTGPDQDEWQTIDKYVVLSILPTVPSAGFFRPGTAPGAKTIHGTEANVRYSVLHSLTGLTDSYSKAEAEADPSIAITHPFWGVSDGEKMRRLEVIGGNNYSANYTPSRNLSQSFLHENHSDADKRQTLLRCIQHGIDYAAAVDAGYSGLGGAGQGYGRAFFPYVAAFALNSSSLLTSAQAMGGAALRQHFWALADELEQGVDFPSSESGSRNESPLLQSDLGIPEWDRDSTDPASRDASPNARYRGFWPIGMGEAMNVALLQNGPGGISGVQAILGGDPYDSTNDRAAALAFYDRVATTWPDSEEMAIPDLDANIRGRWTEHRSLFGLTAWTGRPDWVNGDGDVTASATAGEVDYDRDWDTFQTETITQFDGRYSLDGKQYVEVLDITTSGTFSGLSPGLEHQFGFRKTSASGSSRWSPNYPDSNGFSGDLRNTVTVPGTPANAAPANTTAPQIMVREVEAWSGSDYEGAGASYTTTQRDNDVVLHAGVGYWTGYPAPAFTYQWQADGVNISGETDSTLDPKNRFDLSEVDITCDITATNSQGAVTQSTQTVALPEIVPPANFLADFAAGDASAGWTGTLNATVAYDAGNGELDITLADAFSGASSPAIDVVDGDDYDIAVTFRNDAGGSVNVRVGTTPGGDDIYGSADIGGTSEQEHTTTITATADQIYLTLSRRATATGSNVSIIEASATRVVATSASIVQTSKQENAAYQASHTYTLPSGITDGNKLILVTINGVNGRTLTTPAGWNLVTNGSTSNLSEVRIFERTASSDSSAGVTFTYNLPSTFAAYFAEVDAPVGTVEIASATATDDPPSISPAAGSASYAFFAVAVLERAGNSTTAVPAGYSASDRFGTIASSTSDNHAEGFVSTKIAETGSENPGTFSWTGAPPRDDAAFTIAVG
jgi:hypothetical protein